MEIAVGVGFLLYYFYYFAFEFDCQKLKELWFFRTFIYFYNQTIRIEVDGTEYRNSSGT